MQMTKQHEMTTPYNPKMAHLGLSFSKAFKVIAMVASNLATINRAQGFSAGPPALLPRKTWAPLETPAVVAAAASPSTTVNEGIAAATELSPVGRAAEIATVAVLDVAAPLLLSAAGSLVRRGGSSGAAADWDSFWSSGTSTSAGGDGDTTNADRLASALQTLGPTYVKFGQALASRPDVVPPSLAAALSKLQDSMEPFDTETAKGIITSELLSVNATRSTVESLVGSMSAEPVAAASVGQVYRGVLEGYGDVAVKVKRPGIRALVENDAALVGNLARLIESIPALPKARKEHGHDRRRLIETELVSATDEFFSRLFEELDYKREAANAAKFASLYSLRNGTATDSLPNKEGVVVPTIIPELCTDNVLVMSWIEGEKLTTVTARADGARDWPGDADGKQTLEENLALLEIAIKCTLSQLLDTGILHADPHGGNLLKVASKGQSDVKGAKSDKELPTLAYLDFGILSTVPEQVRDGLICAVAQLVFARDVDACASLFGELQLLPEDVMSDPAERTALAEALTKTMDDALRYPDEEYLAPGETAVPCLLFDKLLDSLSRLVPRFRFQLPPYFINNARALSTLEGIARSLNPDFNVLTFMYPYALNRLLVNPSGSPVVENTFQSLIRSKDTGRVDRHKVSKLLRDSASITSSRRSRIVWDVVKTKGGRRLVLRLSLEEMHHRIFRGAFRPSSRRLHAKSRRRRKKGQSFSNFLRL